jgi:hypothetical protein
MISLLYAIYIIVRSFRKLVVYVDHDFTIINIVFELVTDHRHTYVATMRYIDEIEDAHLDTFEIIEFARVINLKVP